MPTNEERREVARKLRSEKCAWVIWVSAVRNSIGVNGETDGNDILDRIADLIEPEPERTCELKHATWDDGQCTWGCKCSLCGDKFEHESGTTWNYCPHCGAKVVEK